MSAETERAAIRKQWPAEFADGLRFGHTGETEGKREAGGYPKGFHAWPLERRNAWYAGFNVGYTLAQIEKDEQEEKGERHERETP